MWFTDGSIEIIKIDTKLIVITSNVVDALLYTKDIGPVTFFDQNYKS